MTASVASADPLGPGPDPGSGPELEPALQEGLDRTLATLLAAAETTDRADRLPTGHFDRLAELGLFGMVVSPDAGGLGLTPPQIRHVLRRLGSGCGATAFAFAQHHGTTGNVASSTNSALRDRWLPKLTDATLAGIAYAHVRRPGTPVLQARPATGDETDDGAWILDGEAPWVTSWGLAEVFGVAAVSQDGRLFWALVPAAEGPGLQVANRFDLSVYGATATVALRFDRYQVGPEHVIGATDFAAWAEHDRHLAARPNPLCLGIGDRAMALLADADRSYAEALAPRWAALAHRAEVMAVAVDRRQADEAEVAAVRAEVVLATQRLTAALLAAVGGRGMERSHPAQRLHREAGFYVVQAQNAAGRQALLDQVDTGFD